MDFKNDCFGIRNALCNSEDIFWSIFFATDNTTTGFPPKRLLRFWESPGYFREI